jgi:hypothetical protein
MARGSGAGTGVIVALVVSVVTVFGLLTLTFMLYAGKNEAETNRATAESRLADFVTSGEQNSDAGNRVFSLAEANGASVFAYMQDRQQATSSFITGSPKDGVEQMRTSLQLDNDAVVKNTIMDLRSELKASQNEIDSLKRQINDLNQDNSQVRERSKQMELASNQKVDEVTNTFEGYSTATVKYKKQIDTAVNQINDNRTQMEQNFRNKEADLQKKLDNSRNENSVMEAQINELRKKTENYRIRPKNPAELVDGRVISVPSSSQIFIDLGEKDRIIPGMTFEVYDSPASIRVDDRTGDYTRGKASIEIIRVSPNTATARITRAVKGRPVVKEDVIANAIFNRDYRFKFLVHGLFDIDNDGNPTPSESDYVKRRIIEWGGELVDGQELTGDLDFLVLGNQPNMPLPLPPDANDTQFTEYIKLKESRKQYDDLFNQASKAQIPVLNWNRFQVLTGTNTR